MAKQPLVAAALLLAVAACGSSSGEDGSAATGTALTITVSLDEGTDPVTYKLACDPAGGDHPQAQQACDAVTEAGLDVFKPVPADQMCTELYGGPQTATVKGTYDGRKVDATFNRTNGCEIDRWEQLGTTFFDVPML